MEVASAMRMAAALVAVVAVMVRPSPGSPSSVAWQQPCRCHGTGHTGAPPAAFGKLDGVYRDAKTSPLSYP